jgi:hypothetical protein
MRPVLAVPFIALLLSACGFNQPVASLHTECEAPRPQVCTMEYAPVCAYLLAGGSRDYSSGCNACADDAVAVHLPGSCPVAEGS